MSSINIDPEKPKSNRLRIKLVSFLLAIPLAVVTYFSLAPTIGNQPALGAVILISLLWLAVISNVENGLSLVLEISPYLLQVLRQFAQNRDLRSVSNSLSALGRISLMSLLQPIQFSNFLRQRISQDGKKGILIVLFALQLLLFINYSLASLLFRGSKIEGWLWTFFGVSLLLFAVIILETEEYLKSALLRKSSIPSILWLIISTLWVPGIWLIITGMPITEAFSKLRTTTLISGSFAFGLIIGSYFGPRINNDPGYSWKEDSASFIWFWIILPVIILAVHPYSLVPQASINYVAVKNDDILFAVYQLYEEVGSHTQYAEFTIPNIPGQESQANFFTSLPLSVATLIFVGGVAGFLFGKRGGILYILETIVIFVIDVARLIMRKSVFRQDPKSIGYILQMDEWRMDNLGAEETYYYWTARNRPEVLASILIPQIAFSARKSFALDKFSKCILLLKPDVAFESLLALVPIPEFASFDRWLAQDLIQVRSVGTDYRMIYDRRRTIFSELHKRLSQKGKRIYGPLVTALGIMVHANWEEDTQGAFDASAIAKGLETWLDVQRAKVLFLFYKAIHNSLSLNNLKEMGATLGDWQSFADNLGEDVSLLHSKKYAQEFSVIANIAQQMSEKDPLAVAEIAFHHASIEEHLSDDLPKGLMGLKEINLVARHWDKALKAVMIRFVQRSI